MKYFSVHPEVAGGWGENTLVDRTTHPPSVSRLHYVFDGWMGDEIVESFPCYLISETLAKKIEGLSGYRLEDVEVSFSEQFYEVMPEALDEQPFPRWYWLQIVGVPCKDDFSLRSPARLVVSENALALVSPHLRSAEIEPLVADQGASRDSEDLRPEDR